MFRQVRYLLQTTIVLACEDCEVSASAAGAGTRASRPGSVGPRQSTGVGQRLILEEACFATREVVERAVQVRARPTRRGEGTRRVHLVREGGGGGGGGHARRSAA